MSKTVSHTIYTFTELSDQARERVLKNKRDDYAQHDYFWWDDAFASLKAFCGEFNVNIKDYGVGAYTHSYVHTDMDNDNSTFRNKKLASYARDYMPTGYCADCPLWETFHDVWKQTGNPKIAFTHAVDAWIKDVKTDMEYQTSDEYIIEDLKNNDNYYYADGRDYEGE